MAITLTDSAALRVQKLLAKQPGAVALRLGMKKAGCAGMAYTFDIAHEIGVRDEVYEHKGAKIVVDQHSLVFLTGSQLDYVKEGLKEIFKYRNPNEKAACGCGESIGF